jgi:hypothetical protein
MRRMIGTIAVLGFLAAPALAAPGTDPNPNNGNDNGYHGAGQANAGAQCGTGAASGAFGAYSHGVMTTYDVPRAANGQQTGINNSSVCGNRQGNLP